MNRRYDPPLTAVRVSYHAVSASILSRHVRRLVRDEFHRLDSPTIAPLSARVKSPSVTTGDMPTKWASFSSFGARCSASLWYRLTSYGTWSSSWVEGVEGLQIRERDLVKTDQKPKYPLRARAVKMVDSQNHRGGIAGPFELGHYLIVAGDPCSVAYDHLITVFPS